MTYRITYKLGTDDHAKSRDVEFVSKPTNDEVRLAISVWWKVPPSSVTVLSVTPDTSPHPLSVQSLLDPLKK